MIQKENGAYYTPKNLVKFIIDRIYSKKIIKSALEPSSGDGVFLEEIDKKNITEITAVEKNNKELLKSKIKLKNNHNLYNENYLDYHFKSNKTFDLVVGNPPYVSRPLISNEDYNKSIKILEEKNIKIAKLNLWIPFVISSLSKVKEDGIVAFVLPAEFLSTLSSKPIREILSEEFETIEIYSFNNVIFKSIEQDTIIFIGYKEKQEYAYSYFLYEDLEKLLENKYLMRTDYIEKIKFDKWSDIFLNSDEFIFLKNMEVKMNNLNEYIKSSPGVVTGNNKFFIVNKDTLDEYNLHKYSKIILKKSSQLNKKFSLTKNDFIEEHKEEDIYLLDFNKNKDVNEIEQYIKIGKDNGENKGYKCRTRKVWYNIPNVSTGEELIFFKRNHLHPKLVYNKDCILTTDTAYKITCKENIDSKSVFLSFYNILTFIFSEIRGRYYSGGVLELIPSEFKKLPYTYRKYSSKEFETLVNKMNKNGVDSILQYNNQKILKDILKLKDEEIEKLYKIWDILQKRRLKQIN